MVVHPRAEEADLVVGGDVARGEVVEVNDALAESPENINADPYGDGWLVKVRMSDPSEVDSLLDVAAYQDLL